jgi:hypothetical protein
MRKAVLPLLAPIVPMLPSEQHQLAADPERQSNPYSATQPHQKPSPEHHVNDDEFTDVIAGCSRVRGSSPKEDQRHLLSFQ